VGLCKERSQRKDGKIKKGENEKFDRSSYGSMTAQKTRTPATEKDDGGLFGKRSGRGKPGEGRKEFGYVGRKPLETRERRKKGRQESVGMRKRDQGKKLKLGGQREFPVPEAMKGGRHRSLVRASKKSSLHWEPKRTASERLKNKV